MKTLILDTYLEATDMGSDQQEIANFVENHPTWLAFVERVNKETIPASEDGEYPTDEWFDKADFHPDDLITEACSSLGWVSEPQNGGLKMNFNYTND